MDQDDLWEPTFLETTIPLLQTMGQDIAAVYGNRCCITADSEVLFHDHTGEPTLDDCFIASLLSHGQRVTILGALLRREAFETLKGFDEHLRVVEDTDFVIRLLQCYRVVHVPQLFYSFRRYGGRSACANTKPELALRSRIYYLEKYADACEQNAHLRTALQREWAYLYRDQGKYHLAHNDRQQARMFLKRSLKLYPVARKTWLTYLRSLVPF